MWNNSSCIKSSRISTVGIPIFYSLMFVPGLCGNLLTLWIFVRYINKKTSTHIYLINLAISNVMVSMGMPFQVAYYMNANQWPFRSTKCTVVINASNILTHSSMGVSITILCWIAVSRYAMLLRNERRMQNSAQIYGKIIFGQILKTFRNPRFAKYLCICMWIVVLCPNIFFSSSTQYDGPHILCFNEDVEIGNSYTVIGILVESACYFVFTTIVLLFYYFFIKHIKDLQADSSISKKYLIHSIVQRNIIVIIVLLVVCFAPYYFSKILLYVFQGNCRLQSRLVEIKCVLLCLAELRSCSDPIVYLCLDEVFKRNVDRVFCKASDEQTGSTAANKPNTQEILETNSGSKRVSIANAISELKQ